MARGIRHLRKMLLSLSVMKMIKSREMCMATVDARSLLPWMNWKEHHQSDKDGRRCRISGIQYIRLARKKWTSRVKWRKGERRDWNLLLSLPFSRCERISLHSPPRRGLVTSAFPQEWPSFLVSPSLSCVIITTGLAQKTPYGLRELPALNCPRGVNAAQHNNQPFSKSKTNL